jgi:uncharacterized caspase-like protein
MKRILFFVVILLVSGCSKTVKQDPTSNMNAGTPQSPERTFDPYNRPPKSPPLIEQLGKDSKSSYKALVIGNSDYDYSQLQNPVNDAKAMSDKLVKMGFHVTRATNLDHQTMQATVQRFEQGLSGQNVALFYFSGHGAQVNGKNFLIPVDNDDIKENNLENKAVSAQNVLAMMKNTNKGMNILILDACRNNPYNGSEKSNVRGLARVSPPRGALIAFAAAPGQPASDGDGVNGLYTTHLLKALGNAKHKRIEDVFMKIRDPVFKESKNKQEPWYQASLREPFCFGGCSVVNSTLDDF